MKNNDNLFAARTICADDLYVSGIYPAAKTETDIFIKRDSSELRSIVLPAHHGNAYEIKFDSKPSKLRTALCDRDPRDLELGEGIASPVKAGLPYSDTEPDNADFICVPFLHDQYLVIFTDENINITILEHPILLGHDTDDCWFYYPEAGDVLGNDDSWGDYKWTSDELLEHVYEPLREKYPDYITRTWIGKDETNKYDMWSYKFEPKEYEQTLFITAGLHGNEIDGFLALARFLEIMCNEGEQSENEGLKYLRTKVKLIVVPCVNVWSTHKTKIRQNSTNTDLNRDYAEHSQAETINVIWLLHQYKDEVASLIDYHNAHKNAPGLFYQFSIQASNSMVCRKIVNHIQEELKRKGWENDPADLTKIPGAYNKSSVYLQGYAYNRFGIPTLVVEHNVDKWYDLHTASSFRHAVECYGNNMIQTALAKLKILK